MRLTSGFGLARKFVALLLVLVFVGLLYWTEEVGIFAAEPQASAEPQSSADQKTDATGAEPQKQEVRVITREQCIAHEGAVEEIRKNREELAQRTKALEERESEIGAKEAALNEQLKRLQELRDEIAKLQSGSAEKREAKLNRIVETLEAMNPKAAAKMLAALDEGLAVPAMERLSNAKLGKVMNLLEPEVSARLNELLAGVVRAKREPAGGTPASGQTSPQAQEGGAK